jgi:nucleoside-diphosphate-sugar epimerase
MKILVTGSSSHLARALLPRLAAQPEVEQILGVDRRPPVFRDPRYTHVLLDVRSPQLARLMAGIDAVVHLAFVVMQGDLGPERNDRDLIHDINLAGGQNVFRAAAAGGVPVVVHLSSAAVYELPARERPIPEKHPRKPLPGFAYAEDKIALEDWLDGFEREHAEMRIVRLRPHVILGPHAQPYLRSLVRLPFCVRLSHPAPRLQVVHEADVVAAILKALTGDARGAFNLATADAASLRDLKPLSLPLPYALARSLVRLAWRFGRGTEPAWFEGLRHELVLDTTRARRRLGWRPRYDTVAACMKAIDEEA